MVLIVNDGHGDEVGRSEGGMKAGSHDAAMVSTLLSRAAQNDTEWDCRCCCCYNYYYVFLSLEAERGAAVAMRARAQARAQAQARGKHRRAAGRRKEEGAGQRCDGAGNLH